MAIRYYQSGDYNNTILRKTLENEGQVIAGSQTIKITTAGGSAAPDFPALQDSRNDLLRKLLSNQSAVIAGRMTMHLQ